MRISSREGAPQGPIAATPSPPGGASPSAATGDGATFAHVLSSLGREIDRGEGAIRAAESSLGGGTHDGAARLIALQVGVYRYSEIVDIASRLVDRTSGSVKTVLSGGSQ